MPTAVESMDENLDNREDDSEGAGEKAPSSRSSESGEINVLDDFSEGEEEKVEEEEEEQLKPYEENLEEAVALTMQVSVFSFPGTRVRTA